MDNIFIERLWRSLKYGIIHAERIIAEWIEFHNTERHIRRLAVEHRRKSKGSTVAEKSDK